MAPRSTRMVELAQKATGPPPYAAASRLRDKVALDRLDALHTAVKAVRRAARSRSAASTAARSTRCR